jgi:hypothetical protein
MVSAQHLALSIAEDACNAKNNINHATSASQWSSRNSTVRRGNIGTRSSKTRPNHIVTTATIHIFQLSSGMFIGSRSQFLHAVA